MSSSFVSNHYYCESAVDPGKNFQHVLYANDPLWDGKNCDSNEAPCRANSKMPWFYWVLDDIAQDDIELRVCADEAAYYEGTPLDIIELYVDWRTTCEVYICALKELIFSSKTLLILKNSLVYL